MYMTTVTTVTIDGQKVSTYDAIMWASKQFGQNSFRVEHAFPDFKWNFCFADPKQATHFALKWS